MTSRDSILNRLRTATVAFDHMPEVKTRLPVAVVEDTSPQACLDLFVKQAEALQCKVSRCADEDEAIRVVLDTVKPDQRVMTWEFAHIPLPGLADALTGAQITAVTTGDPAIRVGVTGADAAIAATGSLVVNSGPGKARQTSLLPDVHIAVIRQTQIIPTMEMWQAELLAAGPESMTAPSNLMIISGASRTADIAMELVLGAHGPRELHIVIVP